MQNNNALIPYPKPDAPSRLLIIPHAGGNGAQYRKLAKSIEDAEVVVFDLPGRGFSNTTRQPIWFDLMEEWESIIKGYTDKPFIIFGHSFGSSIAYEYLKRDSKNARYLVGSASLAPIIINLKNIPETIHLNDEDFSDFLKKYGLIDDALIKNKDFFKPFLKILRFDFTLMENYRFFLKKDIKIDVPVISLLGNMDNLYSLNQMQDWGYITNNHHETVLFEGDHFYLFQNEKVSHFLNQKLLERS